MSQEEREPAGSELSLEATLISGRLEVLGLLPNSSNYTFLARVHGERESVLAVYKPARGESPLWDFPAGTLHRRERASYLVSRALDWRLIPPTVLRRGPHGVGSLQLFVESDPDLHYLVLPQREAMPAVRRLAVFDWLVNNADRKSGHCLVDGGRLWAIDNALTFAAEYKLRTVIWDFAGEPVTEELRAAVERFGRDLVVTTEPWVHELGRLLSGAEMRALLRRAQKIASGEPMPEPGSWWSVPYPPV